MDERDRRAMNKEQGQISYLDDIIGRLKAIRSFNLTHYREGEYGIETEREYDDDGDYIDSFEIDIIIRELENESDT